MKRFSPDTNFYIFILFVLIIALIGSACSSSGTTVSAKPDKATQAPVQSVTGRQLPTGPVTYVALGASDAVGVGSNQPGSQGYVPLVATHLPKGSHTINLGISGIHLHEALTQELPLALNLAPDLVTIWLVSNDFIAGVPYDSYMRDLDTLLKQLHAGTHARLVMANLPDFTRLPAFANLTPTQKSTMLTNIKRWNAQIATLAAHYHVALVDLFSQGSQLISHPEYISADGFHPSPLGYVQLANAFWQAIQGS
jgi:lysophospholipase L1-like esterase